MRPYRISRRTLLRGAGGIGIALPLLDVMQHERGARAQDDSAKRLVVMYEQSGVVIPEWLPTGSGTDFTLSPTLSVLEPYKDQVVVIDGLPNNAAKSGSGDDHGRGMGTMLTGSPLSGSDNNPSASGISLDQEVANHIGSSTRFKSLEFGVDSGSGHVTNYMSFAGAGQPLPAESNPQNMFDRVFSDFTPADAQGSEPSPDQTLAERQSVLDAAIESYNMMLPRVSSADREKLEAHMNNIREIETRLLSMSSDSQNASVGAGCQVPERPSVGGFRADFQQVAAAQLDLLVMALSCDQTRVCCMQFSREAADPRFTWLGVNVGHHQLSHEDYDSNQSAYTGLASIDRWHAEQFFYLADRMANTQEGDATLLDNTLLLWVNGLTRGNIHNHDNQPIVTAGGGNLGIETGRFLQVPKGSTTNDLYVAILQAFGVDAQTFGDPSFNNVPLGLFYS